MAAKKSQLTNEMIKFTEAFWLELPLAAAQRALGRGSEDDLAKAGWKAYDSAISLTNEATNRLYASDLVASVTGRAMEGSLRLQQAGSALASAFFGNLWPALGLPTANEIKLVRSEIGELRKELSESAASAEKATTTFVSVRGDALKLVRNGRVEREEDDEDAAA